MMMNDSLYCIADDLCLHSWEVYLNACTFIVSSLFLMYAAYKIVVLVRVSHDYHQNLSNEKKSDTDNDMNMNNDGTTSSSTIKNRSIKGGSHHDIHSSKSRISKRSSKEYDLLVACNNREASIAELHRELLDSSNSSNKSSSSSSSSSSSNSDSRELSMALDSDISDVYYILLAWSIVMTCLLIIHITYMYSHLQYDQLLVEVLLTLSSYSLLLSKPQHSSGNGITHNHHYNIQPHTWNIIFELLFIMLSSISWFPLYRMFMSTPSNIALIHFTHTKWLLAFITFTSISITSSLRYYLLTSLQYIKWFGLSTIIAYYSSFLCIEIVTSWSLTDQPVLRTIINNIIIEHLDLDVIRYWNRLSIHIEGTTRIIPTRLFYVVATITIHTITLCVTYLLSDTPTTITTSSSSSTAPISESSTTASHHLGDDDGDDDDDNDYQGLPSDCVEISLEQAIELQEAAMEGRSAVNMMRKRGGR